MPLHWCYCCIELCSLFRLVGCEVQICWGDYVMRNGSLGTCDSRYVCAHFTQTIFLYDLMPMLVYSSSCIIFWPRYTVWSFIAQLGVICWENRFFCVCMLKENFRLRRLTPNSFCAINDHTVVPAIIQLTTVLHPFSECALSSGEIFKKCQSTLFSIKPDTATATTV